MRQFLIEVPHPDELVACARVVKIFLSTGSHFVTHAHWGCMDGNHSAWFIIEAESKQDALLVVPPQFRAEARVIGLNKFTIEQMEQILGKHPANS